MAKRKGNYIDPYWILRSAQEDKASADFLYEKSIQWICSDNQEENFKSISYSQSAINLYALCIEHGLKALLNFEGKKLITGHNIKELFEQLSEDTKNKIKAQLSEERFKVYLDSYLEENKNDFIEWRYNYEEACSASTDFFKDFSTAVIKVGESFRV